MLKDIKKTEMTSEQRTLLAYQTCQWWNAVSVQADRFFEVLQKSHGGTPWDPGEANSMFVAERMFLITAIHHAIEDLEKLDCERQREGDTSLRSVLQKIEIVAPLQDIKNLRDMNEHHLDYLMGKGRKQSQFQTSVEKNGFEIFTTPTWTIIHHDAQMIMVGNIELDKLIIVMKEQLPFVREKTKEIFKQELALA